MIQTFLNHRQLTKLVSLRMFAFDQFHFITSLAVKRMANPFFNRLFKSSLHHVHCINIWWENDWSWLNEWNKSTFYMPGKTTDISDLFFSYQLLARTFWFARTPLGTATATKTSYFFELLSHLFRLVHRLMLANVLELNFKRLYQSSGKERELKVVVLCSRAWHNVKLGSFTL